MALMDAKEYDPRPVRRRLGLLAGAGAILIVLLIFWFWPSGRFRYMHEWSIGNKFFAAIERGDFETAYGLYNADPQWKQHAEKYSNYSLPQFQLDWRPASEYGKIVSHKIGCAIEPPKKGFQSSSGIVLLVSLNHRPDPTLLWVEKMSGSISMSPLTLEELTRDAPLARAICNKS